METIVAKFGGSSLANSTQFKKVYDIVKGNENRRYIVPSAPGKENDQSQKITDLLYLFYELINHNIDYTVVYDLIVNRFKKIIDDLGIDIDITEEFDGIIKDIQGGASKDYASSRGEYLNGRILASYLDYDFVDAKDVIFFNEQGYLDDKKTYAALEEMAQNHTRAVIPGFYGTTPDGHIATFSRGGSDLTGSIVAKGVQATLYENWTDVSGFLVADPRIVDHPRAIHMISYTELRELSYSGAGILHSDAIFPVISDAIPIKIKNTNDPEALGTLIVKSVEDDGEDTHLTGITGRKNFSVISIEKTHMSRDKGFLAKVMSILERNEIHLEHMPSSIDTLSLIVSSASLKGIEQDLIDEFKAVCNPDSIHIDHDIALIAVVGRHLRNQIGASAKLFTALAESQINVEMIIQGASEINIMVGVKNECFEKAIRAIYHAFEDEIE